MHKKFEINQTKINGGCLFGRKVVLHDSKSDLPLVVKSFPSPSCMLSNAIEITQLVIRVTTMRSRTQIPSCRDTRNTIQLMRNLALYSKTAQCTGLNGRMTF